MRSVSAPVDCQAEGRIRLRCGVVMMVGPVVPVMFGCAKCRRSNDQQEQGGEQSFLHGLTVALARSQR